MTHLRQRLMPLRTVVSCFLLAMTSGCMQKRDEVRDVTMIDLEMDLRIGTVDGPVETQFGQVAALAASGVRDRASSVTWTESPYLRTVDWQ